MIDRMLEVARDLRHFGPGFAIGALGQKLSRTPYRLRVGGQDVWCRPGQSDLASVRQTLRESHYRLGIPAYEDDLRARCRAIAATGRRPVIIDAGANIGAACLWFRAEYPEAAIVAIEPDPGNVAMLRRNVAGMRDVAVMAAAIGAKPGSCAVADDGLGWAVQTVRGNDTGGTGGAAVPVVTVDQALAKVADGVLFIVKVDIEGFEEDLFSAHTDWIDRAYAVIVEPHDWLFPERRTSRAFQREMGARDFAMLLHDGNITYIRQGG